MVWMRESAGFVSWAQIQLHAYKLACRALFCNFRLCLQCQGGRGHWDVYYTSPQSPIMTFSYCWLNNPVLLLNVDSFN